MFCLGGFGLVLSWRAKGCRLWVCVCVGEWLVRKESVLGSGVECFWGRNGNIAMSGRGWDTGLC